MMWLKIMYLCLRFLYVGGNLHIFEILVFQIGIQGGYTALPQDFI